MAYFWLTACWAAASADFGKEEAVSIENLGKGDITKQLEQLVQKGESMPRQALRPNSTTPGGQMKRLACVVHKAA